MQQHIAKAHECAANLLPFFQAVVAEDWPRVEQIQVLSIPFVVRPSQR